MDHSSYIGTLIVGSAGMLLGFLEFVPSFISVLIYPQNIMRLNKKPDICYECWQDGNIDRVRKKRGVSRSKPRNQSSKNQDKLRSDNQNIKYKITSWITKSTEAILYNSFASMIISAESIILVKRGVEEGRFGEGWISTSKTLSWITSSVSLTATVLMAVSGLICLWAEAKSKLTNASNFKEIYDDYEISKKFYLNDNFGVNRKQLAAIVINTVRKTSEYIKTDPNSKIENSLTDKKLNYIIKFLIDTSNEAKEIIEERKEKCKNELLIHDDYKIQTDTEVHIAKKLMKKYYIRPLLDLEYFHNTDCKRKPRVWFLAMLTLYYVYKGAANKNAEIDDEREDDNVRNYNSTLEDNAALLCASLFDKINDKPILNIRTLINYETAKEIVTTDRMASEIIDLGDRVRKSFADLDRNYGYKPIALSVVSLITILLAQQATTKGGTGTKDALTALAVTLVIAAIVALFNTIFQLINVAIYARRIVVATDAYNQRSNRWKRPLGLPVASMMLMIFRSRYATVDRTTIQSTWAEAPEREQYIEKYPEIRQDGVDV